MPINTTTKLYGVDPTQRVQKEAATNVVMKRPGMAYPISETLNGGFFNKESGKKLTRNNLDQILRTEPGERVFLPKFGCSLNQYLFQPLDKELFEAIKENIITSITRYARNVEILRIGVFPLDEYGLEGLQAIEVKLLVKLKDSDNVTFDVGVKIG